MPLYAKKRWGTVSAGFPDERPFECPGKQDPGIPPGDDWRYDEILTLAGKEYYDTPLSKYYRKGYNLFIKLRDYKEDVLFFLRHTNVDFTNNKAERGCRKPKRHQAVSGTFRGNTNHSGEEYCDAMSPADNACRGRESLRKSESSISTYLPPKGKTRTSDLLIKNE